jgi:hypothetical protein
MSQKAVMSLMYVKWHSDQETKGLLFFGEKHEEVA